MLSDGEIDVPKDPSHVAWFNLGPLPGENGNSIINGHFGWKDGLPAVFDNLHALDIGDTMYIEDENGITITFIVNKIKKYSKIETTSEIFSSNDSKAHLVLITCAGIWDAKEKKYSERLVIFADMEYRDRF